MPYTSQRNSAGLKLRIKKTHRFLPPIPVSWLQRPMAGRKQAVCTQTVLVSLLNARRGSAVWTLGSWLIVLLWKPAGSLEDKALMEEVGRRICLFMYLLSVCAYACGVGYAHATASTKR